MFESADTERIFAAARRRGLDDAELYAESAYHTEIDCRPMTATLRLDAMRTWITGGLTLRGRDGDVMRQFTANGFDLRALLLRLDGDESSAPPSEVAPLTAANFRPFADSSAKVAALLQALRPVLALEAEGVRAPRLRWRDTTKFFAVAAVDGRRGQGREDQAEAKLDWYIDDKGQKIPFTHARASSSIPDLMKLCEEGRAFTRPVRSTLGLRTAWPGPSGKVPVLWSPLALSKILLQFLRAFEGDLVLGNKSFLNALSLPVPLPFSVLDHPDLSRSSCDNEGSPRRPVIVFQEGRPKALAVNRSLAAQLCVPSTGHGRRERLEATPTVGFWNASVRGTNETPNLPAQLSGGISVQDLQVRRFDPATGALSLQITAASLVHGGSEGECIEPFPLEVPLLELLSTLSTFSAEPETMGFIVEKDNQRLLTEISLPSALSEGLELPGAVPASHYW